jgi:ABC-type transport system substrate-binding protein
VKVRQAFSYALDRKAMADSLGYGLYKPTFQFWGPDYWAYSTTGIVGQPYDPVKAKQLLTEAGYPNGFSTTLYPTAANDQDTLVQDYAKRIGIDMKIQVVSTAVSSQMGLNGWDGFRMNIANLNEYSDPSTITPNFLSKGVTNISSARFPELVDLDLKLRFETDKAKRKILLDAINKGVVDTYTAYLLFYSQTNVMAVSPKLHDTGRYIFTTDYSKVWFSK